MGLENPGSVVPAASEETARLVMSTVTPEENSSTRVSCEYGKQNKNRVSTHACQNDDGGTLGKTSIQKFRELKSKVNKKTVLEQNDCASHFPPRPWQVMCAPAGSLLRGARAWRRRAHHLPGACALSAALLDAFADPR